MSTTAIRRKRPASRHPAKPKSTGTTRKPEPSPQAPLTIERDAYWKLSNAQKQRFRNPECKSEEYMYVAGKPTFATPFDEYLRRIEAAVGAVILNEIYPPDENPIEEEQVVDGKFTTRMRRREDCEYGIAHMSLCLPDVYFDMAFENPYDSAAASLEEIARLLTDAAARVRALKEDAAALSAQEPAAIYAAMRGSEIKMVSGDRNGPAAYAKTWNERNPDHDQASVVVCSNPSAIVWKQADAV